MSKSLKNIIILVLIINIIILALLCIYKYITTNNSINPMTNEKYLSEEEADKILEDTNIYEDTDIVVNNLYELVKNYDGKLPIKNYTSFLYKKLNGKLENLYKDTYNLKDSQLKNYYNTNIQHIKSEYGELTFEEFNKLIKIIEIYKDDNITYTNVEIVKDSCIKNEDYTDSKIEITYSNNEKISFICRLYNEKQSEKSNIDLKPNN